MRKILTFSFIFLFFISIVSSQSGGGGGYVLTKEEFYEMSNDFTKCLIDNCDYFCKEYGSNIGYYYEDGRCWCESYINTAHGDIKSKDGWIEIQECSQEERDIKIKDNISDYKNLRRQRNILFFMVCIFFFIIIVLSMMNLLSKPFKSLKNKKGD